MYVTPGDPNAKASPEVEALLVHLETHEALEGNEKWEVNETPRQKINKTKGDIFGTIGEFFGNE